MNARTVLIAVGLAFGIWETTDIVDTGAPALVFAILFLGCSAWLWRRSSVGAAVALAAWCTVEATQAHTWTGAGPVAKDTAMALGSLGIAAAAWFVARRLAPLAARVRA
jgi:hypothetical protein